MYRNAGAALMTEDCSESFNVIQNNIALAGVGDGPRDSSTGRAGVGYFLRGPTNYGRNNVAAGFQSVAPDTAYGFKYFQKYCEASPSAVTVRVPKFPGADTFDDTQVSLVNMNATPILQFEDNEVY